jgi:hypothetical protein
VSAVTVHLEGYSTGTDPGPGVRVDHWEGMVHLDSRDVDASYPSMTPSEARALAAALTHAASEEDDK